MKNLIEKQAELKERYLVEISVLWQNDKKMIDYCLRLNELYIPILNDSKIICLEKPQIEKEFYFPEHGYDYDEVCQYERNVNKNLENYFIEQNKDHTKKSFHSFRKNFSQEIELNTNAEEQIKKYLMGHSFSKDVTYMAYNGQKMNSPKQIDCINQITFTY